MTRLAILAALIGTPLAAADIQEHDVQRLFIEEPCTAALDRIEAEEITVETIGLMTMTFGFLMGYEVAHPGIRGDQPTLLTRFREDCQAEPGATGLQLLERYAAEAPH